MQKNRLLAAGLAAALLLGVATPAMANKPNKGKKGNPPGHSQPKQKKPAPATKGKKSGVSGGGTMNGGETSIQARPKSNARGHFNYTSATTKVRCRGFDRTNFSVPKPYNGEEVSVTFKNCKVNDQPLAELVVRVIDRGQPQAATALTPAVADWISFSLTDAAAVATAYEGNLTDGNIKVR